MSGFDYPINELWIPQHLSFFPSLFCLSLSLPLSLSMFVYLCLSVPIPYSFFDSPTLRYLNKLFFKTSVLLPSEPMYCWQWFCTVFSSYLQWASKRQLIPSFYMTSIVKRHKRRKGPVIVALLYPGNVDGFRSTETPQGGKSRTSSNRCLYWWWVYHDCRAPSQSLAQHYH